MAAVGLAWPFSPGEPTTAVWLPAASPFVAVASAVSLRAAGVLSLVALPVVLFVLVFPRGFCRHACPVGLLQEQVERVRAGSGRSWRRCPAIGRWLVLLTLGGAVVGYPLFLWLDPLAIFHGFLNAWRPPVSAAVLLTGLALPLLLVLDLAAPRLWCHRACPLGAAQDLLGLPRRWFRRRSRSSPAGRRENSGEADPQRRWFLACLAGAVGAWVVQAARRQPPAPLLRPPGAVDEARFTGLCVRCGNCARICPSKIIQPDRNAGGLAGWLAPRLDFTRDYCREDCHRCNRICPSGAIARLSLSEKRRQVIGLAHVDDDTCLMVLGRECNACIRACPCAAIRVDNSLDPFSPQPLVDTERCNGCGACEIVCPTQPHRAIRVLPVWSKSA